MSIFKKKATTPAAATAATTGAPVEMSAINAQLTLTNATLVSELAAAKETIAEYETLNKLTEQSYALGYDGNVKDLLDETSGNFSDALVLMISKTSVDTPASAASVASFLEVVNNPMGQESNETTTGIPADCNVAYDEMAVLYPKLSAQELTVKCMQKFPTLYGKSEGAQ